MKVQAVYIGKDIVVKSLPSRLVNSKVLMKDPLIAEDQRGRFVALFKYGVAVFWGYSKDSRLRFINRIHHYVRDPSPVRPEEELSINPHGHTDTIDSEMIELRDLSPERIAVVSLVLSRSVALEYLEKEVDSAMDKFEPIMNSFEVKGRINLSIRELLRRAGFAMNVRHLSMSKITLLDRPDLAWDDKELDQFFDKLIREYEIEDRHEVLKEKIEIMFRNVEFILGFIEAKRTLLLELIIVILIALEIVIFVYEVWFL